MNWPSRHDIYNSLDLLEIDPKCAGLFKYLFMEARDGEALADVETKKFVLCNNAFGAMLGYSQKELLKLSVFDIHPPDQLVATLEQFQQIASNQLSLVLNVPLLKKDKSIVYADIKGAPLEIAGKKYLLGSFRDVTERLKMEAELVKAKEMCEISSKSKSLFMALMSHELKTPLNAIIGFSDVLRYDDYGLLNDKQKEYLNYIWQSGNRLLTMVNNILDLSELDTNGIVLEPKNFSVKELLESSLLIVKDKIDLKNLHVSITLAPNVRTIYADERKLKQVVLNLLSNAIKFTP